MDDMGGGRGSSGHAREGLDELDALWEALEENLTAYLATMVDPREEDHLIIELADCAPESEAGCSPYAQFAAFGNGTMIRGEISGDAYLSPRYSLGADGYEFLSTTDWLGNNEAERNWYRELPGAGADELANHVLWVLRTYFRVVHPGLLTYQAWGPAAAGAEVLGLCASGDVPRDVVRDEPPASRTPTVVRGHEPILDCVALMPVDRDDLFHMVGSLLREKYACAPLIDEDGDFVLHHMDQPVWIRVHTQMRAVGISARVAHGVHSRRATAVEIGLLNRDKLWVRWILAERSVWQTLVVPAFPFAPNHMDVMLDLFLEEMTLTRNDLAYRIGARVA